MKRYVLAKHDAGIWSYVYLADMHTGEVTESLASITRTGQKCRVTTSQREPLLDRIAAPKCIQGFYSPMVYAYSVPAKLIEVTL